MPPNGTRLRSSSTRGRESTCPQIFWVSRQHAFKAASQTATSSPQKIPGTKQEDFKLKQQFSPIPDYKPPTPAGVALRNAAPKLPGNGQLSVPPDIFRRTSQVPPSPSPHTAIALPAGHQIAHQSRPWPPALNNCRPPGFMANYHAPLHCAPFLPGLKHWILPCHPKSPPARPRHVPAQNRSGTNMSPP